MKTDATFMSFVDHKAQNIIVGLLSCYAGNILTPRLIRRFVVRIGHSAHLNKNGVDVIVGKQVHILNVFGLLCFSVVVAARPIKSPNSGHPYAAQFFFRQQRLCFYNGFVGVIAIVTGYDKTCTQHNDDFFPCFHIDFFII